MPFSSRVGMMELTGSGPSRLAVDPGSARPMALIRTVLRRSFTSTSGMPDGLDAVHRGRSRWPSLSRDGSCVATAQAGGERLTPAGRLGPGQNVHPSMMMDTLSRRGTVADRRSPLDGTRGRPWRSRPGRQDGWAISSDGGGRRPQRIFQPVFSDLPQQRARADPQQFGGLLPVAPGLEQALLDRLMLQVGQAWSPGGNAARPVRRRRSRCLGAGRGAEMPGAGPIRRPGAGPA